MNVAITKDGVCTNIATFDDIKTAQKFLDYGMWFGADGVAELPDGYGIDDLFNGSVWEKAPPPEYDPPPELGPDNDPIDAIISEMQSQHPRQGGYQNLGNLLRDIVNNQRQAGIWESGE